MWWYTTLTFFQLLFITALANPNIRNNQDETSGYPAEDSDLDLSTCLGCKATINPNDALYYDLAKESIQKYVNEVGYTDYYKVIKVHNVTKQVVAGILIEIYFDASPTNCELDNEELDDCEALNTYITCRSEIWERRWLNEREIKVACGNKGKTKRQVPGGAQEQNIHNPIYRDLAEESLKKYKEDNGLTEAHELLKVLKVTVQVVSGTKTIIDFNARLDPTNIICHSEIWEQPWLKRKVITVTCRKEDCA